MSSQFPLSQYTVSSEQETQKKPVQIKQSDISFLFIHIQLKLYVISYSDIEIIHRLLLSIYYFHVVEFKVLQSFNFQKEVPNTVVRNIIETKGIPLGFTTQAKSGERYTNN